MGLQRRMGLGVTLGVDILGGTNYAVLGAIVNAIKFDGTKADIADLSLLIDTYKQKGKGQIDPGEVSFECAHDASDNAANGTLAALRVMHAATGIQPYPFQFSVPAIPPPGTNVAGTVNFTAHLTSMGLSSEKEKMIVTPIKLTLSGNPNL